jgi:hypothetical protein
MSPVRLPDVEQASHLVAGFQLWMWGPKTDLTNDRSNSPLEEKVFSAIPLGPLFTFLYDSMIHVKNSRELILVNESCPAL